jgi:hypothetical protein
MLFPKPTKFRSQKLLDAAEGQACVLCGTKDTTVSAHANAVEYGKGTSTKADDCLVAWLCAEHHRQIDDNSPLSKEERWEQWHRAFARTVVQWFKQGIVVVK